MNKIIPILLSGVLLCGAVAAAQEMHFIRIETSEPSTPVYQDEEGLETIQIKGMQQNPASKRKWFRIAAEYSTEAEWTDRLTLEYYVLFPGATTVLKGTVNYVDLPKGRDHLSEMYLHFNSYARYYKHGVIQYAVIALVNGRQVAVETNRRKPESWWKEMPVNSNGLLDRSSTPFAVLNVEKFDAQSR